MSRPTARGRVGDFDENSPRPPVPGEETDSSYCCSNNPPFSPPSAPYKYTPRSSNFHSSADLEGNAPLGFEPEGSCTNNYGSCSPFYEGTRSPPPCLQWAKNLSCLLQDNEGVELFRRYLEREGQPHADALNFWFACEGLKKQPNKDMVAQVVKAVYKRFIISPSLAIREDLRREVTSRIRDNFLDKGVFDSVQADVANRIMKTTYPNFLKSDIYLNYIRQLPQEYSSSSGSGSGSGSSSSSVGRDVSLYNGVGSFLPTLPEDSELVVNSCFLPLTKDALAATQTRRALEFRPKPEAFAGVYLQHGSQLNTRVYSSYNPVSRQDSELQSLSSDARTDSDAMSCTDNSVDGNSTSHCKTAKRQHQKQFKAMKENASMNRDNTHLLIPRTQRLKEWPCPLKPEEFARQLITKLEALKREQELQEKFDKFDKKLMETECEPKKTFADMIREKLQMVDDQDNDNQAILDQHVSRVWNDTTPGESPSLASPKPKSPDGRRKLASSAGVPHPYQTKTPYFSKYGYSKKEKDVFSTFSGDSGNVHDFTDVSESSRNFPKSRSFPDYGDSQNTQSGYDGRLKNNRDVSARRSGSKKVASDLTDSGVSVISDSVPCGKYSTEWLIMRVKETCEKANSKHRSVKQPAANSSNNHRHGRKCERSGSLERYPPQSYVPEPTVLNSRPNTASQLEEARRRLTEDDCRGKACKQRYPLPNKMPGTVYPALTPSNSSTLRKSMRRMDPLASQRTPEQEYTTVMYSFWDEEVPYRTKVAGTHVTLKQFKDLLPRKGSYRYYFKTYCAEVDTKVIHEEIFDDDQELPLWEGKLIAQKQFLERDGSYHPGVLHPVETRSSWYRFFSIPQQNQVSPRVVFTDL